MPQVESRGRGLLRYSRHAQLLAGAECQEPHWRSKSTHYTSTSNNKYLAHFSSEDTFPCSSATLQFLATFSKVSIVVFRLGRPEWVGSAARIAYDNTEGN